MPVDHAVVNSVDYIVDNAVDVVVTPPKGDRRTVRVDGVDNAVVNGVDIRGSMSTIARMNESTVSGASAAKPASSACTIGVAAAPGRPDVGASTPMRTGEGKVAEAAAGSAHSPTSTRQSCCGVTALVVDADTAVLGDVDASVVLAVDAGNADLVVVVGMPCSAPPEQATSPTRPTTGAACATRPP